MKYYYDTEFLEGTQKKRFLGIPYGETKPTIDLISIGIVAEDDREYYAISKDFNLWEAWNRFDEKVNMNYKPTFGGGSDGHYNPKFIKEYWIRENVLKPIYYEWIGKDIDFHEVDFTYRDFKTLLNKYGKTNKQIAEEIKTFINEEPVKTSKSSNMTILTDKSKGTILRGYVKPEFYAYYADYDWVAFCWLFGKMIDLPKGFPMYCIDLKQILDEKEMKLMGDIDFRREVLKNSGEGFSSIKTLIGFPKQVNEHNALADAKWNKKLHEFLKTF